MDFKKLFASNFLVFESINYSFTGDCVLVQGENLTDSGQESNGTGKTAFQGIIEYCLYGSTSQKIRDRDLIRHAQEESEVSLTIECKVRKETLKITRYILKKSSSKLTLSINEKPWKFATVNDGNALILSWIGISKDDLQYYYIINRERFKSFFTASNTEKQNIIGRFSNANLIHDVDRDISGEVNELQNTKDSLEREVNRISGLIEGYTYNLQSHDLESFKENKKKRIEDLNIRIKQFEQLEGDKQQQLLGINDKIRNYQRGITRLQSLCILEENKAKELDLSIPLQLLQKINTKISDKLDIYDKAVDKRSQYNSQINEVNRIIQNTEKKLAGFITCPKCSYVFDLNDKDLDVNSVEKYYEDVQVLSDKLHKAYDNLLSGIEAIDVELIKFNAEKNDCNRRIDLLKQKINEIKDLISSYIYKINQSLSQIKLERELTYRLEIEIGNIFKDIQNVSNEIETVKKSNYDSIDVSDLHKKIVNCNKNLEEINDELFKIGEEIFNISSWIDRFKKFKAYLTNRYLKVIETSCNDVLQKINSNIQIIWEGQKILSTGKLSDKITANVIRNGQERDYYSFSGGEKAKMNFAMIMGLREIINQSHPYGGLNFLFTDEIFEGLDGQGLYEMLKVFNEYHFSVLITTHITDRNLFHNILKIVKKNSISCIDVT